MKIIVVDDEAGLRELIRVTLLKDGHEVLEASDGVQGLQLIRSERPDLIIADIKMPKMNGNEMFDIVRSENSDLDVIPFIFISANVNESDRIKHLNGGADGCFEKPIRMSLLKAHVNACLANSKRHADFIKRKMDAIARALPVAVKHDFDAFASLADNVDQYVSIIQSSIQSNLRSGSGISTQKISRPLDYVRFCLGQIDRRRQIVQSMNNEVLTWWLIFTVAESQFSGDTLYVSDLYVSAPAAKTTINSRITMLVEDGVIAKHTPESDARRQSIRLTSKFEQKLHTHIEVSLEMIKEVVA